MNRRVTHFPGLTLGADRANPARLQQGRALHRQGLLVQAQAIYEEILRSEPRHFDALHSLGVIAAQSKNPRQAADLFAKAIASNVQSAVAHHNLGLALTELGQRHAALASYDKALTIKPDFVQALFNRGNLLYRLGQAHAALASYDAVIAAKADHAEAHSNRGVALSYLGQWEAALASFDRAIAIKADYAEPHSNRGNVLGVLKRLDEALASCNQAIAIKSDYAEAYANRGNVLRDLQQPDAALASYDQAIAIKADYVEAYCSRGILLKDLKQLDAALASYDRAIAVDADHADAHTNKAIVLLMRGEFKEGWAEYQWRWKRREIAESVTGGMDSARKIWRGAEAIAGKTLLLQCEQGLGDTLQFCRYATLAAQSGARIILEVQEPLTGLMSSVEGVSQVVAKGSSLPEFDHRCPLLDLPLVFGTTLDTIPNRSAYITSDPARVARWAARLGEKRRPRVGLVWSGNAHHEHDHHRSVVLRQLIDHLPTHLQYVTLQTEVRERDEPALRAGGQVLNLSGELDFYFDDTAALCDCLDLVISVDTSLAHLSGALGKETWLLLSFVSDWRWLLDRHDSPWYPTVRLYRQQKTDDWSDVFEKIRSDLIETFK
ncbi:MAG TPA: tetratricopeptide repeat protein [Steroidobacteraceae bacterium]|jgi:hypothetical protein